MNPEQIDAMKVANDIGLLSWLSLAVAVLTLVVGFGGIVAFLEIRSRAKREARVEARKIAARVSESTAIAYLERELPALLQEYRELATNSAGLEEADAIAAGQEDT